MRIALAMGCWRRVAGAKKPAGTKFVHNINGPPLLSVDSPDIWKIHPGSGSHFPVHPSSTFAAANEQIGAVLDGKVISNDLKSRIAAEINEMKNIIGKTPGLGIVLVGERRDSHTFIRIKVKACNEVGIVSVVAVLPNSSKEDDICDAVSRFNADPSIHGIIVQLPLPKRHHATVSLVHAFTGNPEQVTSQADIVVSDVGIPNTIRGHWLKPGAVVIDTGTNSVKDPDSVSGYRLVGDVCYEEAIQKVAAITPVPGGVGPVTIAMLLSIR